MNQYLITHPFIVSTILFVLVIASVVAVDMRVHKATLAGIAAVIRRDKIAAAITLFVIYAVAFFIVGGLLPLFLRHA